MLKLAEQNNARWEEIEAFHMTYGLTNFKVKEVWLNGKNKSLVEQKYGGKPHLDKREMTC